MKPVQLSLDSPPIRNFLSSLEWGSGMVNAYKRLADEYNASFVLSVNKEYVAEFESEDDYIMFVMMYS